jgi:predicted ATP-grasp superfamily ATP-dependent carboligase
MLSPHLLIVGASARAAAFSALRAGLHPLCVDLFADVDLQQRCLVTRLTGRYPEGFQRFIESYVSCPWMYTGALENHPRFVQRMSQCRGLWGNAEDALMRCRDPKFITAVLNSAGMPAPQVCDIVEKATNKRRWLVKPRKSAAGAGICFWKPGESVGHRRDAYLQEFIAGEPVALLFLGNGETAHLLGITRQLVGEAWLQAAPFHYCGSIGPIDSSLVQSPSLMALGCLLASESRLRGLFGLDGVLRDGVFWPVEINPRYTASVEVLEYATGAPMLAWHAHVFTHRQLPPLSPPVVPANRTIGKAILFARDDLHFPADGPWRAELHSQKPVHEMPAFADIPAAGETIQKGKPILTFFAAGDSPSACEDALRQIASDLDRWLFER